MPIYEYACMECGAGTVLKQFSTFAVAGVSSQPKLGGGGGCCGGSCGSC